MLTTNLHYVKVLLNPCLLGQTRLHDDAKVKVLNIVLWKTVSTPITYAQALKDFIDFVKSQGLFSNTPPNEWPRLTPTWVVGFD
jgi:hypothetical protein